MFKSVFAAFTSLLAWVFFVIPASKQDYVGYVAAEFSYSALLKTPAPAKPKVPTKDCKTCNGTGRVRTGDDQGWTKCPDCDGVVVGGDATAASIVEQAPALKTQPEPPAAPLPPKPVPSRYSR